jgi:dTMP kinase
MEGKLIVFEGPDSVGKSTLCNSVFQIVQDAGHVATLESFPGKRDGSLGRLVYDLHHDLKRFGISKIDQTSLQLLHIAAHIDLIESIIKPKILQGCSAILDRFW